MRKKLKPMNRPPKSCPPWAAAKAGPVRGWKRNPKSAGQIRPSNSREIPRVRVWVSQKSPANHRTPVAFPKRLAHIFRPADRVMKALGVPRHCFQ